MFLARSRIRRQRFQQSRSLSSNKTPEDPEPVTSVTAKRGTFKHFAQSLARFQGLRARRLANPSDPTLGPLPLPAPPSGEPPKSPPFRLHSASSRDEKAPPDHVDVLGYPVPAACLQVALLLAVLMVTFLVIVLYPSFLGMRRLRPGGPPDGHWRTPEFETLTRYGSKKCTIDRKYASELADGVFESEFRFHRKPVIVMFDGGAADWAQPELWTRPHLAASYGGRPMRAGRSDDVVRWSAVATRYVTLEAFLDNFLDGVTDQQDPLYIFDRDFQKMSGLSSSITAPSFLEIPAGPAVLLTGLGGQRSGAAFHAQGDGWSGVVHGVARVFLYPQEWSPPGGIWAAYSAAQWQDLVYPHLEDPHLPLECVLDAGEIIYTPEGMYVQTLSLTDTVMVGTFSQLRHTEEQRLLLRAAANSEHLLHIGISDTERKTMLTENVRLFQELLTMIPDNAEVHLRLGDAYREAGELGNAERHIRHATFMDPHFVLAFLNLARVHDQLGNIAECERNYQMALRLNPTSWESYIRYGDFLVPHRRIEEAVVTLKEGTRLRPDITLLWERLQGALMQSDAAVEAAHVTPVPGG